MKIVSARAYALRIPFVESFSHSLAERGHSDSIVVKLMTNTGVSGYGEGLPRPYVTGESTQTCFSHIREDLLPALLGIEVEQVDASDALARVYGLLPLQDDTVSNNAARSAVELAAVDCYFRSNGISLRDAILPATNRVVYSGIISSGSPARVEKLAQRCREAGVAAIKMKVTKPEDAENVALVCQIMGDGVSVRLDANGAFTRDAASRFLANIADLNIACIEQPIPPGDPDEMAALRSGSPIPIMVDESLMTLQDAEMLIEKKACDLFNLRISKNGGLHDTLAIARLAVSAGIGIQLGCHVGETAILSAAGRHVAAHIKGIRFVEGSYGTRLLIEDIAKEDVSFGQGGLAPLLDGTGIGVTVQDKILEKYAEKRFSIG